MKKTSKLLVASGIISAMFFGISQAQDDSQALEDCASNPASNEVTFFKKKLFGDPCFTRPVGNREDKLTGWKNDSISSIRAGSQAQVMYCKNRHLRGNCRVLTAGQEEPNLKGSGLNDRITSFEIYADGTILCDPGADQVSLYVKKYFLGQCKVLDKGKYLNHVDFGLPNNSVSSVRVGSNVQVCLYRKKNLGGFWKSRITVDDFSIGWLVKNDNTSSAWVNERGDNC